MTEFYNFLFGDVVFLVVCCFYSGVGGFIAGYAWAKGRL